MSLEVWQGGLWQSGLGLSSTSWHPAQHLSPDGVEYLRGYSFPSPAQRPLAGARHPPVVHALSRLGSIWDALPLNCQPVIVIK